MADKDGGKVKNLCLNLLESIEMQLSTGNAFLCKFLSTGVLDLVPMLVSIVLITIK